MASVSAGLAPQVSRMRSAAMLKAVAFGIKRGDALPQALAFPIAAGFAVQPGMGGGDGTRRRAGGRLAELHVKHRAPRGFEWCAARDSAMA